MSWSRGTPVSFTVAWLASVILPSALIATRESRLDSIMDRAASKACLAAVMSRAIVDGRPSKTKSFSQPLVNKLRAFGKEMFKLSVSLPLDPR
jgi:hypothetical protein